MEKIFSVFVMFFLTEVLQGDMIRIYGSKMERGGKMDKEESFLYEYQGNQFHLVKGGWYLEKGKCGIKGIDADSGRLILPDSYQGNPVTRWEMRGEKKTFPAVRFLSVPACMTFISISNRLFPNLERVEVRAGNPAYSSDGQMLMSADGSELIYSLAAGNRAGAVVPGTVKKLGCEAFQYTACAEIVFENPEVLVKNTSFENSVWLEKQGDYCIVGNMFYRLKYPADVLEVPESVRRFHENAFSRAVPKHLVTPVMPSRNCISDLNGRNYYTNGGICRELTITSANAAINLRNLGELSGLCKIHLTGGHKKYVSEDGVLFSKDKKMLVFYPRGREEKRYGIPDGTVKIGREAFAEQKYLEKVDMPDTVTMLGMSAFCGCRSLQEIRFSENIKEIPDSSAYQNGGVFQSCGALRETVLPPRLQYLGSFAFYRCGLQKVVFNDRLRQIGEYAFAECRLPKISLPASVERLGKGALAGIGEIDACAGTAKGLVSAVNTAPHNQSEKRMNVEWRRCMVHVRNRKDDETELFLIPGSLKRTAAYHLDMAWNSDRIDYEEYDACFEEITDPEERMEFAELGILRLKDEEDTPYAAYMRHSAARIAARLLEERKEKEFLAFLERGYLSETAYGRLLKIANKNALTTCSAYLLNRQNAQGGRKAKRFSL